MLALLHFVFVYYRSVVLCVLASLANFLLWLIFCLWSACLLGPFSLEACLWEHLVLFLLLWERLGADWTFTASPASLVCVMFRCSDRVHENQWERNTEVLTAFWGKTDFYESAALKSRKTRRILVLVTVRVFFLPVDRPLLLIGF